MNEEKEGDQEGCKKLLINVSSSCVSPENIVSQLVPLAADEFFMSTTDEDEEGNYTGSSIFELYSSLKGFILKVCVVLYYSSPFASRCSLASLWLFPEGIS